MRLLGLLALAALAGCRAVEGEADLRAPLWYEIGPVHHPITTASPEAQLWFDRGLALTFGFNHEEAVACFQRAAEADPGCAMACWGIAYATGTNYNAPTLTDEASRAAWEALQAALARRAGASALERDLIEALQARYAWPAPADRAPLEAAYADAMRRVRAAHPYDADVAALTAEALMQIRPWRLWSPAGEPAPELPEIRAVLEESLTRWPEHPALCHLYIHAMEAGPDVEQALPAARRLETLTPGLGHLVHMPSHVYTWTGHYADVVRVNLQAVKVDDEYVRHAGRDNLYTLYRIHNYHFVTYGAMFDGQRELALEYAQRLRDEVPAELLDEMPDYLDIFMATPYHVMVRFGLWDRILAQPEPQGPSLLATKAVHHYACGVAYAATGRVPEARAEQAAFRAARAAVPESRLLFQNPVSTVLEVAEQVLAGEIAYREEGYDEAFARLREAAELDERLNYDEPWGWMEPARHALGALLVEQGRYAEAVEVYERNLERYPENGWALFGLAECLRGLGQTVQAAAVEQRFHRAWERSDTVLPGSCFCRTKPRA